MTVSLLITFDRSRGLYNHFIREFGIPDTAEVSWAEKLAKTQSLAPQNLPSNPPNQIWHFPVLQYPGGWTYHQSAANLLLDLQSQKFGFAFRKPQTNHSKGLLEGPSGLKKWPCNSLLKAKAFQKNPEPQVPNHQLWRKGFALLSTKKPTSSFGVPLSHEPLKANKHSKKKT